VTRLRTLASLATMAMLMIPSSAAAATTFVVNSTADNADANAGNGQCLTVGGVCTVRAALQEANALAGADTVSIPAGTYQTGATLPVSTTVTIEGSDGARATVLDGSAAARVLSVTGGGTMTFSGITLTGGAGGLYLDNADLTLDRVAVRDNTVIGAGQNEGGGIYVDSGGSLTVVRSTISGNVAESTGGSFAVGGAISTATGTSVTMVHSTVAGNIARTSASPVGGGLSLRPGTTTTLRHVTLAGNAAIGSGQGGNIYRQDGTAALTITDSIVADGVASSGPNCTGPAATASGRNLDSGTTCGFGAGHLNSTPAALEPLGDHGGPTDTRPPTTASAVRDAALACDVAGTDQRGVPAPAGAACDIGAAELATDLATTLTPSRTSVPAGGDVTFVARARNAGPDPAASAVIDVTLPAGVELVLADPSAGTCTGTRCDVGLIGVGGTESVTVVVRMPTAGAPVTTARSSSAHPDQDASDDAASATTLVVAAAIPDPSPTPTPVARPDVTAPVLGALKAVGKVRRGRSATISTRLSEAATLTLTVQRLVKGRRVGTSCKTGRRTGTACTIAKRVGTVSVKGAAGALRLKLPAKIAGKRLTLGRHRLTVVAKDAAGNRSKSRTLMVTVRR